MTDFSNRSYKKELLDRDDIPFADIQQNMKELEFINSRLGGHNITIAGFKKLAGERKNISVCEIGSGGGDNLNAIYMHSSKKDIHIKFTGIDINADCIVYAKKNTAIPDENFIVSDYKNVDFKNNKPDIIFSSLFCHHFRDEELITMMQWMKANSKLGFFINDLHRHSVAYYFIKLATKLFSRSYLVKNDAPLSVLRGFKKIEWENILDRSGITNYSLKWKWAFRYLIVVKDEQ
ncbi:MAG TPA: methyltransferase domain-containing protein [Chitinophagaceae bacterium]|jgi:2-polyprenyl-3-methyl-5-hydroxy-6-metoxy-1,4-benzoquinol methylase